MPIGTPFHARTLALCETLGYREWAGYLAPGAYEVAHGHEYHAIRNAAALIDISPLFKYVLRGPDAAALVDRIIPRDVRRIPPGRVVYTPWCDETGRVIDDGTVSRLDEDHFRWTAAEPTLRWIVQQADGLDVAVDDVSERIAALALQGPTTAALLRHVADADIDGLKYYQVTRAVIARCPVEISRTGYTGDLGYEIWVRSEDALRVWDAIAEAGPAFGLRPAGLLALDVARIEAGLLLADVDFVGVRKALSPMQVYTPFEMGLDRLVDLAKGPFVGRDALVALRSQGPSRRVVGLTLEWDDIESLYASVGLPPALQAHASRVAAAVFSGGRQVGRMTSSTWSPTLKRMIGLATVEVQFAVTGVALEVDHAVEATRRRIRARVVPTPFFDPARKKQTPPA